MHFQRTTTQCSSTTWEDITTALYCTSIDLYLRASNVIYQNRMEFDGLGCTCKISLKISKKNETDANKVVEKNYYVIDIQCHCSLHKNYPSSLLQRTRGPCVSTNCMDTFLTWVCVRFGVPDDCSTTSLRLLALNPNGSGIVSSPHVYMQNDVLQFYCTGCLFHAQSVWD